VRKVIEDECKFEILRHGEDVPSELDLEVFGSLPPDVLKRMQGLADACSLFLGQDAGDDHFEDHNRRTEFKGEGKETYGEAFKEVFERNRFRISSFTVVIGAFVHFKELIDRDDTAWGRGVAAEDKVVPKAEEFRALFSEFEAALGKFGSNQEQKEQLAALNACYHKMTIHQKLELVDFFSAMAHKYLAIVTGKKWEPTPPSQT